MNKIKCILQETSSRPFPLPLGNWKWYQEWHNALFLHWIMPADLIKTIIPPKLRLDTFQNYAVVTAIAYTMKNVRLRNMPSLAIVSDFHQLNLRTYVVQNGKPGIFITHIEAQKHISVLVAKILSGLPYEKAIMKRTQYNETHTYSSENKLRKLNFRAEYKIGRPIENKSEFDNWLINRYCLYYEQYNNIFRYDIHRPEWELSLVSLTNLEANFKIGDFALDCNPSLVHYSRGVNILAWKRKLCS